MRFSTFFANQARKSSGGFGRMVIARIFDIGNAQHMNKIMRIYQTCEKLPMGKIIFSKLLCYKAPYFGSIKPRFLELAPGYLILGEK